MPPHGALEPASGITASQRNSDAADLPATGLSSASTPLGLHQAVPRKPKFSFDKRRSRAQMNDLWQPEARRTPFAHPGFWEYNSPRDRERDAHRVARFVATHPPVDPAEARLREMLVSLRGSEQEMRERAPSATAAAVFDERFDSDCDWLAEGPNTAAQWVAVARQGALAMRVLSDSAARGEPLSIQLLREAHRELLKGAQDPTEPESLCPGSFRSTRCFAGRIEFSDPSDVRDHLDATVERFEQHLRDGTHAIEAAVWLLLDFVITHPFVNGNGRLARLLFSYALLRAGFPFAVEFTTGHRRAYDHLITALRRAHETGRRRDLLAIGWASVMAVVESEQV